jgi:uncharacterized membrane protein YfcA
MILSFLIFAVAVLYSSVGQAGASGYIAAMALFGVAPAAMKPSALILNILVASLATFRFCRAGHFSWRAFLPLALGSVPFAFLGGVIDLPDAIYRQVIGVFLLFTAYRVLVPPKRREAVQPAGTLRLPVAIVCGAGIGLLAGLTGIGGGIFLAPLLMLTGRFDTRESAGISAAFILVNSLAAIAGCVSGTAEIPGDLVYWAIAAVAGGLIGSELGIRHLGQVALRRLLAVVLVFTGARLVAKN